MVTLRKGHSTSRPAECDIAATSSTPSCGGVAWASLLHPIVVGQECWPCDVQQQRESAMRLAVATRPIDSDSDSEGMQSCTDTATEIESGAADGPEDGDGPSSATGLMTMQERAADRMLAHAGSSRQGKYDRSAEGVGQRRPYR